MERLDKMKSVLFHCKIIYIKKICTAVNENLRVGSKKWIRVDITNYLITVSNVSHLIASKIKLILISLYNIYVKYLMNKLQETETSPKYPKFRERKSFFHYLCRHVGVLYFTNELSR